MSTYRLPPVRALIAELLTAAEPGNERCAMASERNVQFSAPTWLLPAAPSAAGSKPCSLGLPITSPSERVRQPRGSLPMKLPVNTWLRGYDRSWIRGDVIAGSTVWAVLVPEALA
jgi:hypothetical protein